MKTNNTENLKIKNSYVPKIFSNSRFYQIICDKNIKELINVENLVKSYGKHIVLKGINLKINKGERVAIIGANGAGKTTLMETISQVRIPDSGKITYNFSKLCDPRTKIGFQFQESKYPGNLRVKDIINFYKQLYYDTTDSKQINYLLKVFHLEEFLKKSINKMSGGQKQRFNVLLSVLHSPELLILDELSTGLDIQTRSYIKEFIKNLIVQNNYTLMLVSHNMDEAEFLCERFVIIDDGKIKYDLPKRDIIKQYKSVTNFVEKLFLKDKKSVKDFGTGNYKV